MIKFGEFAIDADEYGYRAGYLKTQTAKKDGAEIEQEIVYRPLYTSTLSGAIQALLRREQRSLINSSDMDLKTALRAFQTLQTTFQDYLSEIKEEIADAE